MLAGSKLYTLETLFKPAHTKLSHHSPNWGHLTRDFEVNTTPTEMFSVDNHFLSSQLLLSTISACAQTIRNQDFFSILTNFADRISLFSTLMVKQVIATFWGTRDSQPLNYQLSQGYQYFKVRKAGKGHTRRLNILGPNNF